MKTLTILVSVVYLILSVYTLKDPAKMGRKIVLKIFNSDPYVWEISYWLTAGIGLILLQALMRIAFFPNLSVNCSFILGIAIAAPWITSFLCSGIRGIRQVPVRNDHRTS